MQPWNTTETSKASVHNSRSLGDKRMKNITPAEAIPKDWTSRLAWKRLVKQTRSSDVTNSARLFLFITKYGRRSRMARATHSYDLRDSTSLRVCSCPSPATAPLSLTVPRVSTPVIIERSRSTAAFGARELQHHELQYVTDVTTGRCRGP